MKRCLIYLLMLALLGPTISGCFGKFALTRKVYEVNASVQDRYLRNVVTWAFLIVPVYWVSGLADVIVFNTVEFWSGQNPVLAGEQRFQYSKDGQDFSILATKRGEIVTYTIDRFANGIYQDTMTISSDLQTLARAVAVHEDGRVTLQVVDGGRDGSQLRASAQIAVAAMAGFPL